MGNARFCAAAVIFSFLIGCSGANVGGHAPEATPQTTEDAAPIKGDSVAFVLRLQLGDTQTTSPATLAATAIIENRGAETLVFARTQFRLLVDGAGASYGPNPIGVIPPWPVQALEPSEKASRPFNPGLNDGYGIWSLNPGTYSVRAMYWLTPEDVSFIQRAAGEGAITIPEGSLWVGEVRSEPVTLVVSARGR